MNYPVWNLDVFGGGLLIALIAVFHVYISHFAVGGGLFLVLTEMKGYREDNPSIIEYVRKHAKFFLLVTMVAGSMTGVGIWFTIALLNPAATSVLIHNYVFGWATEWVFFLIEIISLFIYAYTFGRLDRRTHLFMGWIYFFAAWMSLFIINGIIDFMLTPGSWLENHNFWSGFFNPTFWPALFFRTFMALLIAGLFGLLTATRIKDDELRNNLVRHCALYLLIPVILLLGSAWWYRAALPPELQTMIFQVMPEMKPFINGFMYFSPLFIIGGLVMIIRIPRCMACTVAVILLIVGQLYMGCFEFMREGGRRPYIIRDYMYSTSIFKQDMEKVQQNGLLHEAKWVKYREITEENRLEAGKEIYNILCLSCHSINGVLNPIQPLTKNYIPAGLDAMISGMDTIHPYMPPFAGTAEERSALAYYIAYGLNGRQDPRVAPEIEAAKVTIPPFDPDKDEYVLLAWNNMGMHCLSDSSPRWTLLPPANDLYAQLIRRDGTPEIVTEGITIHYKIEESFGDPAAQVSFWKNAESTFGKSLAKNTGLSGNGLTGIMQAEEEYFSADLLPVFPYPSTGGYNPYPSFTVEAKDSQGNILATTQVVAPASTEMGCRNCHGGEWRVAGRAGFTLATTENILAIHDRLSGTDLVGQVENGGPLLCQKCHADPILGAEGNPGRLNMSAALHGFHAGFLKNRGAEACALCHPSSPLGATKCLRGIHKEVGLDCTSCHGSLEDHALSLLKSEQEKGKKRANVLMARLQPREVASIDEIAARQPWINEPDCLNCHVDFQAPETDSAFNTWTASNDELFRNRRDESGQLFCSACHSSPHAIYPASNEYGENLDNIQPMQYQGNSLPIGSNMNCAVCHTMEMDEEMHHPNMLREFRNQ